MSSCHLYFHRDCSLNDRIQFAGRLDRFLLSCTYNVLGNILRKPVLSVVADDTKQLHLTVFIDDISRRQFLSVIHAHIKRCVLAPVGKSPLRCIKLKR